jgi:ArsR family transcriptional regulator, cadmium/lead-responsive transcriptional repressor
VTGRVRSYDEEVWLAVADPSRRSLLELLINNCDATASGLASEVPFSRQAVAKHLAVLEKAQLVSSRRQGREVIFSVRPSQIDNAAQMMVSVGNSWDARLRSIKRIAEDLHKSTLTPSDVEQTALPESPNSHERATRASGARKRN